jgi:hypothetical protein
MFTHVDKRVRKGKKIPEHMQRPFILREHHQVATSKNRRAELRRQGVVIKDKDTVVKAAAIAKNMIANAQDIAE